MASNPPVTSATSTNLEGLREIKPPVWIPDYWKWVLLAGLALIALALAWALWKKWRARRFEAQKPRELSAAEKARQRLDEALRHRGDSKIFVTLTSDAIRHYLEDRFELHAPERTSEEFFFELASTEILSEEEKAFLTDFLTRADLVKFARYQPSDPELEYLHESAVKLVEATAQANALAQPA